MPTVAPAPVAPASRLEALTPEQREAVLHGFGPLLIFAGPGAGKTRTITERIAYLLASGQAHSAQILAVTFTVAAAGEMRERLASMLGVDAIRGLTVATFHSVCARLLRTHAGCFGRDGDYTIYDQNDLAKIVTTLLSDKERSAIQHQLDVLGARSGEGKTPAAEIVKEISLAKNRLWHPAHYAQVAKHPLAPLIAAVWEDTELEMKASNAFDFDDLLVYGVRLLGEYPQLLAYYRQRWPWMLVDEFQDTNFAQMCMVSLLAGPAGNVTVVADDDQCLVQGTQVTMADGARRAIETIRPGEEVLASKGGGRFGAARVLRVHQARERDGVAIKLASGKQIVSTPAHTHFAGFVASEMGGSYTTYLMWKRDVGFRVGVAAGAYIMGRGRRARIGAAQRCLHERADAVWLLGTQTSDNEARLHEAVLAASYGLPTMTFRAVHGAGSFVGDQSVIDRLYRRLDTTTPAMRLLADHGLSFEHPHHRAQSHSGRGGVENVRRRTVTVTLCSDARGPRPAHRVSVRGTDHAGRLALKELGLPVYEHSRGHGGWTMDTYRVDYGEAISIADQVGAALGAEIRQTARLARAADGRQNSKSLPFCPAKHVRPGMVMVNADGEFEKVVAVEAVKIDVPVYDLDIEDAHNYVANDVVTHNSIYAFRGSDSGNILRFGDWFPNFRSVTLGRNYRCRAEILTAAAGCVQHNLERVPKQLVAMRGPGGRVETPVFANDRQEAEFITGLVVEHLNAGVSPDEILLVARNGYVTLPVQQSLAGNGIPYRVLGSLGLFERAEVKDAIAYLELIGNPVDAQAFRRAIGAPKRGVGTATASRVIEHARDRHAGDLIAACCDAANIAGKLAKGARTALADFGRGLDGIRRELARGRSVSHAVVAAVMMPGGLVSHFKGIVENAEEADKRRDAERVLADLRSLCEAANTYVQNVDGEPSMIGFLETACGLDGAQEIEGEDTRLTISTIHRSKGMEATLVVLIGCEERLLPSWRSLEDDGQPTDAPQGGVEEERRLFYVAVTRAKDRLVITQAQERGERRTEGTSRFLTEAGLA